MFVQTTIVLILCATLVLTLSVNNSKADGFLKNNREGVTIVRFRNTDDSSSSTVSSKTTKEYSKNESLSPIMAEGGPIYQSQNLMINNEESSTNDTQSKLPKTRNASIVARKGVVASSKITARKGVGPESLPPTDSRNESAEVTLKKLSQEKNINSRLMEIPSNTTGTTILEKKPFYNPKDVHVSVKGTNVTAGNVFINETKKNETLSSTTKIVPTIPTKIANVTTIASNSSTKRFKAKPTVTIGEMDIDKPIPASPTKTPPLGMPRKIDYIVPVIITIMALPLLGGATFFLYRRGRDCWDKRHYRRMDFLIDGMYNDYSWK